MRWQTRLPDPGVTGISVAADGTSFVSTSGHITALTGPEVKWTVAAAAPSGCLLVHDGLLVAWEAGELVVRARESGSVTATIDAPTLCAPAVTPNGLLVFLKSSAVHATTLTGQPVWQHGLAEAWSPYPPLIHRDQVIVADGAAVRAFDLAGSPIWTAHDGEPGEIIGPLVGLPDGAVLAAVRAGDLAGYLVVDQSGRRHRVHLPPKGLALPLSGDLVVAPGWPQEDHTGQFRPTVAIVDIESGATVHDHVVAAAPHTMAAGSNGLVAIAGSPDPGRWRDYRDWPGYDLQAECYVQFLDRTGLRAQWQPGAPVTGPVAVSGDGELLVPVSGELFCVQ